MLESAMRSRFVRRWDERLSSSAVARSSVAVGLVGFVCLNVTLIGGLLVGVQGALWFRDAHWVLIAFAAFLGGTGAAWDGLLLGFGAGRAALHRWGALARQPSSERWLEPWRRRGFFSIGWWPLPMVLVTIYFLICTSNISYISLRLLEASPRWQDPVLWEIEGAWLIGIVQIAGHVGFWETIYNSGWNAEMLALFAVIVATRCPVRLAAFLVSFLLLFYLGRLAGLATPVMGPAFFAPEHFPHLEGSVTSWMMQKVAATMEAGSAAIQTGAMRLGGVAAMPSLHVGMVAVAGWWLTRSVPWTWPLVVVWVLAVWASTVLLGWHYALDGLGGLVTAALCIALSHPILRWLSVEERDPRPASSARVRP